ncbi:phosphoheptose isomerase [Aquipuribacter hungaricus]|uniref:class I mannose-6-phosphate isomerase n=1 Tax=Aquipuribacter hungaricus TaxID=545624 RepID=UPI0030EC0D73
MLLPPNRLVHFYAGGEAITALRGVPAPDGRSPEEWVASTTTRHGEASTGLSPLPGGGLLRDAVAADPDGWTGGVLPGGPGDVGVLVKLLDAGQRLPVHVHPDRVFASSHLGSCYGKTEAWYVLDAVPGARVHLGWRDDVDPDDLARAVLAEDSGWMLDRMHAVDVVPGDVVLVPAGTVHAIGAGIFVVEVQEPSDFSLLLEHVGFSGPEEAFLGLDVAGAVAATGTRALPPGDLAGLCRHVPPGSTGPLPLRVLPEQADPFFAADLLGPGGASVDVPAGFGILVVLDGSGVAVCADGGVAVSRGDVLAVPHGAGAWQLTGEVTAVLCRPSAAGTA